VKQVGVRGWFVGWSFCPLSSAPRLGDIKTCTACNVADKKFWKGEREGENLF
jgi:hypothetical protein